MHNQSVRSAMSIRGAAKAASAPAAILLVALSILLNPIPAISVEPGQTSVSSRQTYNISAGPLASALNRFAEFSGHELIYDSTLTQGIKTQGLSGSYTPEEALQRLLNGSGLSAKPGGKGTYTIEKATARLDSTSGGGTALPKVTVKGQASYATDDPYNPDYYRRNASTATKTDTPLMETPMSVKVVPQQVLQDQQVVRLDQALKNVSGVVSGSGGERQFFIRGFDTYNYYRDGYPFKNQLFHTEDLTNVERVEVLKGPGSILYGRADPGGIINFVIKQPQKTPYYSLRQQFGSFDWYRTNADATGPLSASGDVAYRFNIGYQSNNTFQEFGGEERLFVAPAFRWEISERTHSTFKLEYSDIKKTGEGNLPLIGNRPAKLPRRQNLGDPWNFQEDEYVMLSLNTEHEFNDNWKILHRFNFSTYDYSTAAMSVNGNWDSVTPSGDFGRFFFAQNIDGKDFLNNYYNALEVTGKFDTGPLKHTLLVGGDYLRSDVRSTMAGFGANPAHYDITNIFTPRHLSAAPSISPADIQENHWSLPWFGLYAQDQITLPFNFHALAGLRYDQAETSEYYRFAGVRTPKTVDTNDRVSPRGGLLWQPIPELSLYGSYTENFGASNTFGNFLNNPLPPQTAEQWELGAKTQFWDGRFSASLAYFDLTKQNVKLDVAPGISRAIGEAESRGIEVDIAGELLPGWSVIGGYAYMPFAKTLKDSPGTGTEGKRLHNAPEHSGSLWTTYEVQEGELRGLKLGVGMQAVGQRQIGFNETAQAPGYAVANLMASYGWTVGKARLTAQLNIDNLADKTFIDHVYSYGPSHYGTPRTYLGSLKLEY